MAMFFLNEPCFFLPLVYCISSCLCVSDKCWDCHGWVTPDLWLSSPGSTSCCLEDQVTWAPALLPGMPLLSCVGITSLQARAEQLVLALSAVMLYHSVDICCCVFTQVLTLQPKPRLHKCISSFIQWLCRGSCKALPVESGSCFAGMQKPDDFSMCPAKIMPNNLVCILISQSCWEKLIHQCSDSVCLQTCLSEASASSSWAHPNCYCLPGVMGSKGHQRLSHRLEGTGARLASLCAWIRAAAASCLLPGEVFFCWKVLDSVWLFLPAGRAQSSLFFKEKVCLPPNGASIPGW